MKVSVSIAIILVSSLINSASARALCEIFDRLKKCSEHCENEASCVHGCRLIEAANRGNCEKACESVANREQCLKGCNFDVRPDIAFRRVIIRTNIPSLQFGQGLEMVNRMLQLHMLSRLPLLHALRDNSSQLNGADEENDGGPKPAAVSLVKIPLIPRCNRLMTLKEWAALQQQRIANGTLECWLIASMIVLLSCTLWLLIWIRHVKHRRQRRALVCEEVEKGAATTASSEEEKLPEYNNVVDSCKV